MAIGIPWLVNVNVGKSKFLVLLNRSFSFRERSIISIHKFF